MGMLALVLGAVFIGYFGIGRAVCPPADRLPLHELDNDDVIGTVRRGWHALGQHWDHL